MKALLISAVPCEQVRELGPEGYLGFRTLNCEAIEHLIVSKGRVVRARRKCDDCVLGQLARHGFILSNPTITSEGFIRMASTDSAGVRRILRKYRHQIVAVEEIDLRGLILTPKQRMAVALLADGASNISGVARALGISKTAAWKLVKKSIKKIARLHA